MAKVKIGVEFDPVITAKVDAALARIQSKAKGIDFGGGASTLDKLSRPLGKITGQANEFQKSLEASNARVLAFGASVAVINKLSQAFSALVSNTIKVEATFAKINTILGGTEKQLQQFGNGIFKVAQKTATSFDDVAEGALELARQGLSVEESLSRVETALKLVRVAGVSSQQAVAGLTAAVKGFEGAGLTVAQIGDKLSEVDTKFAVSTEDLINGLERASASARVAGVSFDELLAVVTTVQERTQRGGAVIGNAFKTIFARLSSSDTLSTLQDLGIEVLDTSGNVKGAIPLFKELAAELNQLGLKSVEAGDIIQKVAGVRQRDILISLVEDLNSSQSQFSKALQVSTTAAGALDSRNSALNQTLEALINNLVVGGQKLASVLGELGFTDKAKDIIDFFGSVVNGITDLLQGESLGAKFAQGIIRGIGGVITVPGLALIGGIFIKLFVDLAKFGASSLSSLLGINKAAQEQNALQQSVLQTLFQNENVQREILALEGNKVAQEQLLLKIYNQQAAALARVQKAAAVVTPGLFGAGLRGGSSGVVKGKAADGYIASEARDVSRGVGGAPSSAKVVSIPNFAFGNGKRGTMVANTSEYLVPDYAGGGDAIFNKDMVKTMGLPAGAEKLNAAGGFIPNFANRNVSQYGFLVPEAGANRPLKAFDVSIGGKKTTLTGARAKGIIPGQAKTVSDPIEDRIRESVINSSTAYANELQPLGRNVSKADIESGFGTIAGAKGALQSAIGSAFEVGITKALDYKAAIREKGGDFDIRGGVNLSRIQKLFGLPNMTTVADLKVSDSVGNVESFYSKVMKEIGAGSFGDREKKANAKILAAQQVKSKYPQFYTSRGILKTRGISSDDKNRMLNLESKTTNKILTSRFGGASAAGGYIPNFAGGALDQAVAREQAAGLPINQIRINQSGKLRSSQNPMGLAVTNTRDEPTGAIPNFAAGGRSTPATPGGSSDGGFNGGLIAASTGLYFLSSAFSNAESTFGKFISQAAFAASALTSLTLLKGPIENIGAKLSNFGLDLATKPKGGKVAGGLGRGIAGVGGALPGIGMAVAIGAIVAPLVLELTKTKTGFERLNEELKNIDLGELSSGSKEASAVLRSAFVADLKAANDKADLAKKLDVKADADIGEIIEKQIKGLTGINKGAFGGVKDKDTLSASLAKVGNKDALQDIITASQKDVTNVFENPVRGTTRTTVSKQFDAELFAKNMIVAIDEINAKAEKLAENAAKIDLEGKFGAGALTGGFAKNEFQKNITQGKFAAGGFDTQIDKPGTGPGSLGTTTTQVGALSKIRASEFQLAKAITTESKVALENQIALAKNSIDADKERFQITEDYVKSIEDSNVFRKDEFDLIQKAVSEGKNLIEIEQLILDLNGELNVVQQESFTLALAKLDVKNQELAAQEQEIENQNAINNLNKAQGFGEGIKKGIGGLQESITFFGDELGENIPRKFSDNLGSALVDAVSEAKTLDEALSDAGRNFLGFMRDAFLQQAADQFSSVLFGGLSAGADAAKSSLFGGAIGSAAGKPDGTASNPIHTTTSSLGSNAAGAVAGEGQGEGIFSKLKNVLSESFGGLKTIFSDLFGGLKEGLGTIFKGLTTGLSSLFSGGGGGGGGGIFSTLLGAFGFGFANGGPVGFANGGSVGSTDTLPAMLTPGEFVMKKSAVDKYGSGFLSSLNESTMPMRGFENGGVVGPVSAETGTGAGIGSKVTNNSDFTFNIQEGKVNQEGGQGSSENQKDFAQRIKAAVSTVVQEESRTGGALNYLYKK